MQLFFSFPFLKLPLSWGVGPGEGPLHLWLHNATLWHDVIPNSKQRPTLLIKHHLFNCVHMVSLHFSSLLHYHPFSLSAIPSAPHHSCFRSHITHVEKVKPKEESPGQTESPLSGELLKVCHLKIRENETEKTGLGKCNQRKSQGKEKASWKVGQRFWRSVFCPCDIMSFLIICFWLDAM